jgi:hypothetical protein
VLLGVAAGVAAAGKYVGTAFVPVAALIGANVGGGTARERWRRARKVPGIALLTWLALDDRVFRSPGLIVPRSLGEEMSKAFLGKHGLLKETLREAYEPYFAADRIIEDQSFVKARRAFYQTALERGRVFGSGSREGSSTRSSPRFRSPIAASSSRSRRWGFARARPPRSPSPTTTTAGSRSRRR